MKRELENRIDTTAKNEAFITLKDHKPNFNNNPNVRMSQQNKQTNKQNKTKNCSNSERTNRR